MALAFCVAQAAMAQDTTARRTTKPTITVSGSDHLMLQLGTTWWNNKPDSIRTKGFSRSFNIYFMFAFPFKTNPKMSAAIGAGLATDHIFFDRTRVGITDATASLQFEDRRDTSYFKKYKVATSYLEVPVELRFSARPQDDKHSFKVALGAKVATMLAAWTKAKELANREGQSINDYTEKLKSKRFFNSTRLSATARIGYGHFSLFGSYALTPLFKEGAGPQVRPVTVGITLSGL